MQEISTQTTPERTAQVMIKGLKKNHAMGDYPAMSSDTLQGDERAAFRKFGQPADWLAIDSALAITGESFSGNNAYFMS